jgi:hypothetical protein
VFQPEHEFHVVGDEITIEFHVPLPAEGEDDVLTELLTHHAFEIIRDRKHRGQPLNGIPVARIFGRRRGQSAEVTVLDLDQPEEMLEMEIPEGIPLRLSTSYDPLARFGEREENDTLALAERRSDGLPPLAEEIRLTGCLATELRSVGVDPEEMTASELGTGLLRLSGYQLRDRGDGTLVAAGHGSTTFVAFADHETGEYPELAETAITSFLVAFARARTERGLFITDKYGPYMIYQKERANPDTMFVTRERLQAFVDTIALS